MKVFTVILQYLLLWYLSGARDAVDACNRCMLGVESSQISVLYYLMYASAAGSFDNLIKATEYKGQEYRIKVNSL